MNSRSERRSGCPLSLSLSVVSGRRRSQWDWDVVFTGLFVVTGPARRWCVVKRCMKQLMPNEESFSKTQSGQFWSINRGFITQKSWLQWPLTHKRSNLNFISHDHSRARLLNFPKHPHSPPPGEAKLSPMRNMTLAVLIQGDSKWWSSLVRGLHYMYS